MSFRVDFSELRNHLINIFPQPWPGYVIIEVVKDDQDQAKRRIVKQILLDNVQALDDFPTNILNVYTEQQHNFYFLCGFTPGNKKNKFLYSKKKEDITHLGFLWADVDDVTEEQVLERAQGCVLPPTGVVRTGGGAHFYWMLETAVEADDKHLLDSLRKVVRWVGGDKISKVNQIAALPGTYKFKPWKYSEPNMIKVLNWDRRKIYSLEQFMSIGITPSEIRLPADFVQNHIVAGNPTLGEDKTRSARDFIIMKELLRAGHNRDDIESIFHNSAYGCSDKVLERGGTHYFSVTFTKALAECGNNPMEGGIGIVDNGKVVLRKKVAKNGNIVEDVVSNFVIKPKELHIYEQSNTFTLLTDVICGNMVREIVVSSDMLVSPKNFLGQCGIPGVSWLGDHKDWAMYVAYIHNQTDSSNRYPATRVLGWYKKGFIAPNYRYQAKYLRYQDSGFSPEVYITRPKEGFSFKRYMGEMFEALNDLGNDYTSYMLFGWLAASLFAPQLRRFYDRQFPIACLSGEPGAGKTTTAGGLMSALCGVLRPYGFEDSPALLRRAMGSSNCFVMYVDEFECGRSPEKEAYFRYSYNASPVSRCDISTKFSAQEDIRLTAPLMLGTITPPKDQALKDRMTYLRLTAREHEGKEGIHWFTAQPPGLFAYYAIREDIRDIKDEIDEILRGIKRNNKISDRQKICIAVPQGTFNYYNKKYFKQNIDIREKEVQNDEKPYADKANDYIDTFVSYAIRNPGYTGMYHEQNWRVAVVAGTKYLAIHRAQLLDVLSGTRIKLELPIHLTREWMSEILNDKDKDKNSGVIKTHPIVMRGNKTIRCVLFELKKFPEMGHAVEEAIV